MYSKCYIIASAEGRVQRLKLAKQIRNTINLQSIRAGEKAFSSVSHINGGVVKSFPILLCLPWVCVDGKNNANCRKMESCFDQRCQSEKLHLQIKNTAKYRPNRQNLTQVKGIIPIVMQLAHNRHQVLELVKTSLTL